MIFDKSVTTIHKIKYDCGCHTITNKSTLKSSWSSWICSVSPHQSSQNKTNKKALFNKFYPQPYSSTKLVKSLIAFSDFLTSLTLKTKGQTVFDKTDQTQHIILCTFKWCQKSLWNTSTNIYTHAFDKIDIDIYIMLCKHTMTITMLLRFRCSKDMPPKS